MNSDTSTPASALKKLNHQRLIRLQSDLRTLKTEEKSLRKAIDVLVGQRIQLQVEALELKSRAQSMPTEEDKIREAEMKGPRVTRQHGPARGDVRGKTEVLGQDEDDVNQEVIDLGPDPNAVLDKMMRGFVVQEEEEEEEDDDDK